MARIHIPSKKYLEECFQYEDGKLYWLKRPLYHFKNEHGYKVWNNSHPGKEAGCIQRNERGLERAVINVNKIQYYRSNIIWMFFKGEFLDKNVEIYHYDKNSLNDKIENLYIRRFFQADDRWL